MGQGFCSTHFSKNGGKGYLMSKKKSWKPTSWQTCPWTFQNKKLWRALAALHRTATEPQKGHREVVTAMVVLITVTEVIIVEVLLGDADCDVGDGSGDYGEDMLVVMVMVGIVMSMVKGSCRS